MNWHKATEAQLNKRLAEICPVVIDRINLEGVIFIDDGECLLGFREFNPCHDYRDTGLVIEKLKELGQLCVSSIGVALLLEVDSIKVPSKDTQKALCILLCLACEDD